jgi:hypothetical protein
MNEDKEPYPEHAKLKKVKERSQCVGEFLEWLGTEEIMLGTYTRVSGRRSESFMTIGESTESLLARFFDIDLNKLEEEKCAMLEEIRKANSKPRMEKKK